MPYPIKTCVVCGEEFELTPNKPGFANRCFECSVNDEENTLGAKGASERNPERDAARRDAMRNLLYRKDE